jgi:hypothetical protein
MKNNVRQVNFSPFDVVVVVVAEITVVADNEVVCVRRPPGGLSPNGTPVGIVTLLPLGEISPIPGPVSPLSTTSGIAVEFTPRVTIPV